MKMSPLSPLSPRPAEQPAPRYTAPDELRTLARDVSRLTVWAGNPEQFVMTKETIARQLRQLARKLELAA